MGHRVKTGAYMVETLDFDLFWTAVAESIDLKVAIINLGWKDV
jgi:hypothetical protein